MQSVREWSVKHRIVTNLKASLPVKPLRFLFTPLSNCISAKTFCCRVFHAHLARERGSSPTGVRTAGSQSCPSPDAAAVPGQALVIRSAARKAIIYGTAVCQTLTNPPFALTLNFSVAAMKTISGKKKTSVSHLSPHFSARWALRYPER